MEGKHKINVHPACAHHPKSARTVSITRVPISILSTQLYLLLLLSTYKAQPETLFPLPNNPPKPKPSLLLSSDYLGHEIKREEAWQDGESGTSAVSLLCSELFDSHRNRMPPGATPAAHHFLQREDLRCRCH